MNDRKLLPLILVLALSACGEGGSTEYPVATKTSLGKVAAGNLSVELLTDTRLETGLTPICLKVGTAAGEPVTDAVVTFTPMMQMADGNHHSAPMIGPPALDAEGCYRLFVIFQMFTGPAGTWSATVKVTRAGVTSEGTFASLLIADSGRAKTFLAPDETKYVVSLNYKATLKVGLNPIIVTVHRKQDALTFPAVEDAVLGLDPQMPSMGHGSPGSLDPTHTSQGRYEGELSFSMPGDWETTVTVKRNGVVQGAPKFRVDF